MKTQKSILNSTPLISKTDPVTIPLLPRHKMELFCIAGNGYRFARLFRQVWRQIPLGIRRGLLKAWRQSRPTQWDLTWPSFELIGGKSDFSRGNSAEAMAQYKHYFHSFAFDSRYVDALSDDAVKTLIAHEMGHAVLAMEDAEDHLARCTYDCYGFSDGEEDADTLAEYWGFDPDALYAESSKLPHFPQVGER